MAAAGGSDETVYFLDHTGASIWRNHIKAEAYSVAITSDGSYVAVGAYEITSIWGDDPNIGYLYLFDRNGDVLWSFEIEKNHPSKVAITPDGSYIAAGFGPYLYLLNHNGKIIWKVLMGGGVGAVAMTPDGSYTAAGSLGLLVGLINKDGKKIWDYGIDNVMSVDITRDGSKVIVGGDGVYLFNQNGDILWRSQLNKRFWSVAISHDGSYVVAGSRDGYLYIFNQDGEILWSDKLGGIIRCVSIVSDGSYVAAGSENGNVYFLKKVSATSTSQDLNTSEVQPEEKTTPEIPAKEETTPAIPTDKENGIPGFEAILFTAGLLVVAYLLRRRK
ncbi:MAG: PQQ-binding-like beta-propeller repeat protein [Halobacteriota archaeon]